MKYPITNGYITSPFGYRTLKGTKEFHGGIDVSSKDPMPLIIAPCRMQVYITGWSNSFGFRVWAKLFEGNLKGKYIVFAHMLKINKAITPMFELSQGDLIGWMGSTGMSIAPHLHMEVRDKPMLGSKSYDCKEYIL
jgi:murein DD-endopeptidase MepM/ murein hydrolase activator NlpD